MSKFPQVVVNRLLEKKRGQRLALTRALTASAAVAALVVGNDTTRVFEDGDAEHAGIRRTTADGVVGNIASPADTWGGAEVMATPPKSPHAETPCHGPAAAAAAREALGAEVDDPEELYMALTALQREHSGVYGPAATGLVMHSESALESLSQDLQVRLGALREDANEPGCCTA